METVIGLKGKDYVMLAADTMLAKNIYFLRDNCSKIRVLSSNSMVGVIGNEGDSTKFADFIATRVSLYEIANGYSMDTPIVTHFARQHLLSSLASRIKFVVSMLVACFDTKRGASLCYIDSKGASQYLNYSGQGIGNSVSMSIFHTMWRPDLSIEDGLAIVRRCVTEIQSRLIVNFRHFEIFLLDKNGVRKLEVFCPLPVSDQIFPQRLIPDALK
ncbi:probable proteasome subunit beta type-2 [Drosophila mojavensis]|uniref:Proteasome subunit beta n=1 Tax=Drosophila mojavensis TaxID=7230 RepID=B4KL46_DROMO|nr:probable proteasome subunit beta type-2 [Drosophila mojavensis]EDW12796.1 uncharacterized protein Dmoj_GI17867, isoform A [Drosophila mojavensis]